MEPNRPSLTSPSDLPRKEKTSISTLVSRNVTVSGRRTSVRLEPQMWNGLSEICRRERATLHEVCTSVAVYKEAETSLTAAIRVFIVEYYRKAATEEGHTRAGHGRNSIVDGAVQSLAARVMSSVSTSSSSSNAAPVTATPAAMTPRPMNASPYMMGMNRMGSYR